MTQVVDTYIYYAMLNTGNIGMTSAAGLLQNVIGLFCILGARMYGHGPRVVYQLVTGPPAAAWRDGIRPYCV